MNLPFSVAPMDHKVKRKNSCCPFYRSTCIQGKTRVYGWKEAFQVKHKCEGCGIVTYSFVDDVALQDAIDNHGSEYFADGLLKSAVTYPEHHMFHRYRRTHSGQMILLEAP